MVISEREAEQGGSWRDGAEDWGKPSDESIDTEERWQPDVVTNADARGSVHVAAGNERPRTLAIEPFEPVSRSVEDQFDLGTSFGAASRSSATHSRH